MNEFLKDLTALRYMGHWFLNSYGSLRVRDSDGHYDCPISAVAKYRGITGIESYLTITGKIVLDLGLYLYQGHEIIKAVDFSKALGLHESQLRQSILLALGLEE